VAVLVPKAKATNFAQNVEYNAYVVFKKKCIKKLSDKAV
jgi:hypothetical protein